MTRALTDAEKAANAKRKRRCARRRLHDALSRAGQLDRTDRVIIGRDLVRRTQIHRVRVIAVPPYNWRRACRTLAYVPPWKLAR